jgi:hypothetical protein
MEHRRKFMTRGAIINWDPRFLSWCWSCFIFRRGAVVNMCHWFNWNLRPLSWFYYWSCNTFSRDAIINMATLLLIKNFVLIKTIFPLCIFFILFQLFFFLIDHFLSSIVGKLFLNINCLVCSNDLVIYSSSLMWASC